MKMCTTLTENVFSHENVYNLWQPQVFLMMPEEQRTHLKWQYLLEQCKVVFKVHCNQGNGIHQPPFH